jgi:serine protease Do
VLSTKYSALSTQSVPTVVAVYFAALITILLTFASPLLAQSDELDQEEKALRDAVARVAPSVVRIETIGGLERVGKVLVNLGPTTGLVVDEDGYIVSSAFNFIQQPTSILVTLPSGTRAAAKIVARDHSRMLVLLKVNSSQKLTVPEAAPKSDITVGQWAIAAGRTYDAKEPNVSVGLVSAINRIYSIALQTDAKISPANYGGPLIDIHGRVLGVLVPLSPQRQGGEVAGAEWYDSGIGFAIPLEDINQRLADLKDGKDLRPGLMGIALKTGDPYSTPAELAAVPFGSPAQKAGLKAGDTIIAIDGMPIERQSQLKHALGPRYAGDKLTVIYTRGKDNVERKKVELELAEKLIPYEHPFLGILPERGVPAVVVRHVYPDSPAAKAGVKPGDHVTAANGTEISTAEQLRLLVANLEPKTKLSLTISRGGKNNELEIAPAKLPTAIPKELPPFIPNVEQAANAEKPATGVVEIKLPEEKNVCFAYVPEAYSTTAPHGVLVYLAQPGPVDQDKLLARWKNICNERQLILLVPQSGEADKWQPTEVEFIKKTLADITSHYNVDSTRIAVYGYQSGGAMAFLYGLENVDRVRAIVAVDAAPPSRVKLPDSDPVNRLAFFVAAAEKSPLAPVVKELTSALESQKFPVTRQSLGQDPRDLNDEEREALARWLDTLDRI